MTLKSRLFGQTTVTATFMFLHGNYLPSKYQVRRDTVRLGLGCAATKKEKWKKEKTKGR